MAVEDAEGIQRLSTLHAQVLGAKNPSDPHIRP